MQSKKYLVILSPNAIDDIQKGIDYYKEIDISLGKRFYDAIKSTMNELSRFPNYQIKYKNVRVRAVKRFPYLMHFIIEDNKVIVYGVRFDKMKKNEIE